MKADAARYCRSCSVRLARDNKGSQCGSCATKARDLMASAPAVPPEFWDHPRMRDALDSWHMGAVIAAYRSHPHHGRVLKQEVVAGWVGLTQTQLSRIENGPAIKDLDKLIQWATILGIPAGLLWFRLPAQRTGKQPADSFHHVSSPPPAVPLPTAGPFQLVRVGGRANDNSGSDVAAMRAFRSADRQVGGGHLYATVVRYLHDDVAPRMFGRDDDTDSKTVFTAAAALTEMAGWMAHDAGRDDQAQRHFGRALDMSQVGHDRQLSVHVLASMSHLAQHMSRPYDAIRLANTGQKALSTGPRNPDLEARVFAMQARGFAALHRPRETADCLGRAENALSRNYDEEPSTWVSRFDEGSLASEAARCLRQLGELPQAQRHAERIIELRSVDSTRSRAFGQLLLVTVLIEQGELDQACVIAQDVLDATQSLGSYLVIQQLRDIQRLLQLHTTIPAVAEFLTSLTEALRQRIWLYQWLTKDASASSAGA